jgi:serine/threonine-protein kinase
MAGFRRGGSGHALGMTGPGTLIADRYRVVRHLGSGAMATVHLADDELLGRQVAIKSVHADAKSDFGRRVLREARMGAALAHPNLVAVFDTIVVDDAVLIVMEYVPGRTLADALQEGRMAPEQALAILRPLAEAIDRTHAAGIVHRDVKPANVLLHERGDVKLADLGVATSDEVSRITRTGGVVGTAAYMAPEQFESGPVDGAADVYALAAVAFEMLSGRRAFPAPDALAALVQRSQDLPDLRELVPDAPEAAAGAVRRGLAP